MSPYREIALGIFGIFVLLFVSVFGRAGISGIFFHKIRFGPLARWQLFRVYELDGPSAIILGRILLGVCFACICSWIVTLAGEIAGK